MEKPAPVWTSYYGARLMLIALERLDRRSPLAPGRNWDEWAEWANTMLDMLPCLTVRKRKAVTDYYGLLGKHHTLDQIGRELCMSREGARHVVQSALAEMLLLPQKIMNRNAWLEKQETERNREADPWGIRIEELDFSTRTYNCLKKADLQTVGDLTRTTSDDLLNIRNLGIGCLREVREKIGQHGVALKGE